jgi:hypothetical protein
MLLKPSHLIAAKRLWALVSASVSDRWYHPSQPRQDHASIHPPTNGVPLSGVVKRAPGKRHGGTRGGWAIQTMSHLVIHGPIEVKPAGESKRRIGDESKGTVDLTTTTRQSTRIMVGDHLVDRAAKLRDGQP